MYGTSDRIGHRTIERKSPSSEENLNVRKKTRKGSEEKCIGYPVGYCGRRCVAGHFGLEPAMRSRRWHSDAVGRPMDVPN